MTISKKVRLQSEIANTIYDFIRYKVINSEHPAYQAIDGKPVCIEYKLNK